MIKTKTPRHWGGGIRQVSPPMLTSRLSNIGRWRTNGWKDYSRSRRNRERFWIYKNGNGNLSNKRFKNFEHGFHTKNCICFKHYRSRGCNQTFYFIAERKNSSVCYFRHILARCFDKFSSTSRNNGTGHGLTLKGVA